ncbi:hypothetical protein AUJ46_04380 [Candidatus Peregrinibacteria bacterium CG1_02_54_53]|nr:MAG: hypothetical protein AUJ46_04380 [Candidatus Peregrinibacteria bacterium CG1_02_54_53]
MQQRSSRDGKEPIARALGQTFATLQHLSDLAFAWGSRKLKQAGSGAEANVQKGIWSKLKRVGKRSARFVGTMGDAYYDWYERLKAQKRS